MFQNIFVHINEKCHTGNPSSQFLLNYICLLSLMQLWPEPERGPQRNPLKASSEVCTGLLRCTPLGLKKGSDGEKYLYGLSCCKVCKAFANGCMQSVQCTVYSTVECKRATQNPTVQLISVSCGVHSTACVHSNAVHLGWILDMQLCIVQSAMDDEKIQSNRRVQCSRTMCKIAMGGQLERKCRCCSLLWSVENLPRSLRKLYLSELQKVFVQVSKYICQRWWRCCSRRGSLRKLCFPCVKLIDNQDARDENGPNKQRSPVSINSKVILCNFHESMKIQSPIYLPYQHMACMIKWQNI